MTITRDDIRPLEDAVNELCCLQSAWREVGGPEGGEIQPFMYGRFFDCVEALQAAFTEALPLLDKMDIGGAAFAEAAGMSPGFAAKFTAWQDQYSADPEKSGEAYLAVVRAPVRTLEDARGLLDAIKRESDFGEGSIDADADNEGKALLAALEVATLRGKLDSLQTAFLEGEARWLEAHAAAVHACIASEPFNPDTIRTALAGVVDHLEKQAERLRTAAEYGGGTGERPQDSNPGEGRLNSEERRLLRLSNLEVIRKRVSATWSAVQLVRGIDDMIEAKGLLFLIDDALEVIHDDLEGSIDDAKRQEGA